MSETLAEKTCTPCRGGVPPLKRDEAHAARLRKSVEEFAFDLRFEAADAADPADPGGPSKSVDHGDSALALKQFHTKDQGIAVRLATFKGPTGGLPYPRANTSRIDLGGRL